MVQFVAASSLRKWGAEERQILRKAAEATSLANATFLSHSSKDKELVEGATLILRNHGAQVYTDEIDPSMPPFTSSETARILRKRISNSKRFVLLATENSKESKWVPWELGLADGVKGNWPIALFPASEQENRTGWAQWEYLGLYQKIAWGTIKGSEKNQWLVWDQSNNSAVPLGNWISGS